MAIKKILNGENGEFLGQYHRIGEVVFDFNTNQTHVSLNHYANENYRELEKDQLNEIEKSKVRYNELSTKDSKYLTDKEKADMMILDPKNLESMEIVPKHIKLSKFTFDMEKDVDLKSIYEKLNQLELFKGAENI